MIKGGTGKKKGKRCKYATLLLKLKERWTNCWDTLRNMSKCKSKYCNKHHICFHSYFVIRKLGKQCVWPFDSLKKYFCTLRLSPSATCKAKLFFLMPVSSLGSTNAAEHKLWCIWLNSVHTCILLKACMIVSVWAWHRHIIQGSKEKLGAVTMGDDLWRQGKANFEIHQNVMMWELTWFVGLIWQPQAFKNVF